MDLPVSGHSPTPPARRRIILIGGLAVVVLAFNLWNREPDTSPDAGLNPVGTSEEYQRGERLSKLICSSCHLYTPPDLLDKVTWGMEILPAMAKKLGFHEGRYEDLGLPPRVHAAKIIPPVPTIRIEDWRAICTYYLTAAPVAAAPPAARDPIKIGLKQFDVIQPEFRGAGDTTLLQIDAPHQRIFLGQRHEHDLVVLDPRGRRLSQTVLDSPPASLQVRADGLYVTLMGSYTPSDELQGKVVLVPGSDSHEPARDLLTDLPRPVRTLVADLNGDGKEDLLVCGFGNQLGSFSWFENRGNGRYVEHVLLDRPGAIAAEVHDFNHDGRPDLIVMMAQAREGIYIFYNQGNGEFSAPVPVVEHHAAWGSSYFELVDFNHDGFMDILATNGDEGDHPRYLPPYKSFHGLRLYLNDGKNNFKEAWFYPMSGAYKAVARDFDGDGDLDIAAISFYPQYRTRPYESFVYLENLGGMKFTAYSFPEALSGRWITMEVGDLDGDGRPDIVLGSMQTGATLVPAALYERWKSDGPTLLILKNHPH